MDSKIFELALQWQGMHKQHNYLFTNYKKRKRKRKRDNQPEKKRLET